MEEKQIKYPMTEAVRAAYRSGEDDESLEPRVLVDSGKPIGRFKTGIMLFSIISGVSGRWSSAGACWIKTLLISPWPKIST